MAINRQLAKSMKLDEQTQDQIEELQDIRDMIRLEISDAVDREDMGYAERLVGSLVILNYTLQDMWGFPRDKEKHNEDLYRYGA